MYLTGADLIDMTVSSSNARGNPADDARSFAERRDAAGRDARRCREEPKLFAH